MSSPIESHSYGHSWVVVVIGRAVVVVVGTVVDVVVETVVVVVVV